MTSTEQDYLVITVENRATLHALPVGTRYVDIEGDEIVKRDDGQWYMVAMDRPWGVALLEEFLPGLVINPEIL